MSGYAKEALHNFQQPTPSQPHKPPHQWNPHNYGSTAPKLEHQAPESPKLATTKDNTVQQVVGTFMYYVCAVNPKIPVSLNSIATEQSTRTEATAKEVTQMLNYVAKHSEAITKYHASGMILHIHSDASLLSDPGSKIRAVGYHYFSMASSDPKKAPPKQPSLNGPVHVKYTTTRNILASAIQEELGDLLIATREAHRCAWRS